MAVPDFMSREAPPNYIAGLGRGAAGFTTRSDIGNAVDHQETDPNDPSYDPEREAALFKHAPYERDDEEADRIWEQVEASMAERRGTRRIREQDSVDSNNTTSINLHFKDLKRNLAQVSNDEWASIPDVANMTRRKKVSNLGDRFSAVPDSVILGSINVGMTNSINEQDESQSSSQDLTQFGAARDKVLGLKLDQMANSVGGQSSTDATGYLDGLGSVALKSDAEISDIKKARTLLQSVISTNPKHAPGWIAACRLEEVANKLTAAKDIIARGCEECPRNEDVWLEAARLNTPDSAKIILANAIRQVPQSIKIWIRAQELEIDVSAKKRVVRKAIEHIPNSILLWKTAVSLEDDQENAKILLSRAVECIPTSIELWLALVRLETYANGKKILNKARTVLPTSHEIWITAAKLEEENSDQAKVDLIITRGTQQLIAKGSKINREQWIQEAEVCESEGFIGVCKSIIQTSIGTGIELSLQKHTFIDDAEQCVLRKSIETARNIYSYLIQTFPEKKSVWRRAAFFEREHGTSRQLEEVLENAVTNCPNAEILWLMAAKDKWQSGNIPAAKIILERAFAANENSEQIWLAAIKLEVETGNIETARTFLEQARIKANTPRVWMKSVMLEWQTKSIAAAFQLVNTSLVSFPTFAKLWMIKGQMLTLESKDIPAARLNYSQALKYHPKNTILWILASRLEESSGGTVKARSTLEKARIINPIASDLWVESIRVEQRAGNTAMAKALLAKSLQTNSSSGELWSLAILMDPRPQRKSRSADALKKCENDAHVVCTIAKLFWSERKYDKARNWFNRAIQTQSTLGDTYCWFLKFEIMHGTESTRLDVISKCQEAEPKYGELWTGISKDVALSLKHLEIKDLVQLIASKLENDL